jgi:alpha-tubulin suppressor-like RCC1 family protein
MKRFTSFVALLLAAPACVFDGAIVEVEPAGSGGAGGSASSTSGETVTTNATVATSTTSTGGGGAGEGGSGGGPEPFFDCDLSGAVVTEELDSWEAGTCARLSSGEVYCWGWDSWGQLGRGFYDVPGSNPDPILIDDMPVAHQVEIFYAGCAIVGDCYAPELYCWGRNGEGQAGQLPQMSVEVLAPTKVELPGPVSDVALGWSHTCAIVHEAGTPEVYCWGVNYYGQTGSPVSNDPIAPTKVVLGPNEVPVDVLAAYQTTCVLVTVDGAQSGARCFGHNGSGILGSSGPDSATPVVHPHAGPGLAMDATFHACTFGGNSFLCWGSNVNGQLNGVPDIDPHPDPLGFAISDTSIIDFAIGPGGQLFRTFDGTVDAWHAIGSGKLIPTTDPAPPMLTTATFAPQLTGFDIVTASGNNCGVDATGNVYCWGSTTNYKGSMGPNFNPANEMHLVPLP